jgi:DNA-binding winged helix-turn-helix (wHTH) protein
MIYVFGDFELDEHRYELRRAGEPLKLEPKVFEVLAYLIRHRDRFVSRDELIEKLWPGQVVSEAALTRCVAEARKAVGDDGVRQQAIRTQYGRGYRFVAEVTERDDESRVTLRQAHPEQGRRAQGDQGSVQDPGHQPFVLSPSKHENMDLAMESRRPDIGTSF